MITKTTNKTIKKLSLHKTKGDWLIFSLFCTLSLSTQTSSALANESADLTEMPLEQLLNVEIISASKYLQRQSDIPATTTVINAKQIKGFGYRTLSDVLRSVPGLYVSSNVRDYDNLGVRGLSGASEFNGRIVVLIDGYRLNEALYDGGSIGTEFPVDIDLVERVEVIRGPASSIYGSNALYGIINVVTKSGNSFAGGEAAMAYSSYDTYKGRISYGNKLDNGLEFLVSGSGFDSRGANLYFPDLATPETNNGHTRTTGENGQQAFAKASYGDFSLIGAWGRRIRTIPGAPFGTNFNDPDFQYEDTHAFVQLQYQTELMDKLNFTARAWYGDYTFNGLYPYGDIHNKDTARANWSGFELRLLSTHFDNQHITGGIEVQQNWTQKQNNYDLNPLTVYLDDRRESLRIGIYLQDDIKITDNLNLSIGGRFDHYSLVDEPMFSPKAGLTWQALEDTTLKLLYGSSFRAPNAWHQFYAYTAYFNDDGSVSSQGLRPATGLKPESAQTLQGSWEQKWGQEWLTRVTLYHIWLKDLFATTSSDEAYFYNINGKPQSAFGGEFEVEGHWNNGALVRASYSLQQAQTQDKQHLFDSPRQLFKVNMLSPLFHPDLQGGLEILGMGARDSRAAKVAGYVITNATLNWQLHSKVNLSASVYNLFDKQIFEPRGDGVRVPADGINFRVKLQVNF